jgi:hypothetical protein
MSQAQQRLSASTRSSVWCRLFKRCHLCRPIAPTQSEPPFLIAQIAVLAVFVVLGVVATIRFHPKPSVAA